VLDDFASLIWPKIAAENVCSSAQKRDCCNPGVGRVADGRHPQPVGEACWHLEIALGDHRLFPFTFSVRLDRARHFSANVAQFGDHGVEPIGNRRGMRFSGYWDEWEVIRQVIAVGRQRDVAVANAIRTQ
jgi:hypothetical protein